MYTHLALARIEIVDYVTSNTKLKTIKFSWLGMAIYFSSVCLLYLIKIAPLLFIFCVLSLPTTVLLSIWWNELRYSAGAVSITHPI